MQYLLKISCFVFLIYWCASCKTHDNNPSKISQLQGVWTIDSIVVYENKQQTGFGYALPSTAGTVEFRSDNNMYSDYTVPNNGYVDHLTDTSRYNYDAGKNLIIMSTIDQATALPTSDSLSVILLTDSRLVYSQLDQSPLDYYPKTYLHKK